MPLFNMNNTNSNTSKEDNKKNKKLTIIIILFIIFSILLGFLLVILIMFNNRGKNQVIEKEVNNIYSNLLASINEKYHSSVPEGQYVELNKLISLSFDKDNEYMKYSASSIDNSKLVSASISYINKGYIDIETLAEEYKQDNYRVNITSLDIKDICSEEYNFFSNPKITESYIPHNNDIYKVGGVSNPNKKYISLSYIAKDNNHAYSISEFSYFNEVNDFDVSKMSQYNKEKQIYSYSLISLMISRR